MKETQTIEQNINENSNPEEDKKLQVPNLAKIKTLLATVKKPKLITLGILLITAIVVLLALNLVSTKKEEEVPTTRVETLTSPNPSPSADPSLENIAQRVKAYNDKLDKLEKYQKKLIYPIVDLEISFQQ